MLNPHLPKSYPYGIELTWSDDYRVATITTQGDMRPAAIDSWKEATLEVIHGWSPDEPICILFDVSSPNQGYTWYAARRTQDIYDALPKERVGFAAVVMRDTLILWQMFHLLRKLYGKHDGRVKEGYYKSLPNAYAWLRKCLEEYDSQQAKV